LGAAKPSVVAIAGYYGSYSSSDISYEHAFVALFVDISDVLLVTGFFLNQRGWQEVGYIEAPDMETAEQIFFSSLQQVSEKTATNQSPAQPSIANSDALI